ncbi:MAG: hypothetical protein ACYC97_06850, partial [Metallibacterium sp.]
GLEYPDTGVRNGQHDGGRKQYQKPVATMHGHPLSARYRSVRKIHPAQRRSTPLDPRLALRASGDDEKYVRSARG